MGRILHQVCGVSFSLKLLMPQKSGVTQWTFISIIVYRAQTTDVVIHEAFFRAVGTLRNKLNRHRGDTLGYRSLPSLLYHDGGPGIVHICSQAGVIGCSTSRIGEQAV